MNQLERPSTFWYFCLIGSKVVVLGGPVLFSAVDVYFAATESDFWSDLSVIFIAANFLKLGIDNFLVNRASRARFNFLVVIGFSLLPILAAIVVIAPLALVGINISLEIILLSTTFSLLYVLGSFLRAMDRQSVANIYDPNLLFWPLLICWLLSDSNVTVNDLLEISIVGLVVLVVFYLWLAETNFRKMISSIGECYGLLMQYGKSVWWIFPSSMSNWALGAGSIWFLNLVIPKDMQSVFILLYRIVQSCRLLPALANFAIAPAISRKWQTGDDLSENDMYRFRKLRDLGRWYVFIAGSLVLIYVLTFEVNSYIALFCILSFGVELYIVNRSFITCVLFSFGRVSEMNLVNLAVAFVLYSIGSLVSWHSTLFIFLALALSRFYFLSFLSRQYVNEL